VEYLRGKRLELVSIDVRRRRADPGTPVRGALDAAYRDVLAECAELEASVEAMETSSRLGVSSLASRLGVSSKQSNASGMDARLVDAGSRAAGLLERAEAMRREMSEVSKRVSSETTVSAAGSPETQLDWGSAAGLGRRRKGPFERNV
jgi:hypothetical protein